MDLNDPKIRDNTSYHRAANVQNQYNVLPMSNMQHQKGFISSQLTASQHIIDNRRRSEPTTIQGSRAE